MSVQELIDELKRQPNLKVPVVVVSQRVSAEATDVRWTGAAVVIEG